MREECGTKTGTEIWESYSGFVCPVCGGTAFRIPENATEAYLIRECKMCGKLDIRKAD